MTMTITFLFVDSSVSSDSDPDYLIMDYSPVQAQASLDISEECCGGGDTSMNIRIFENEEEYLSRSEDTSSDVSSEPMEVLELTSEYELKYVAALLVYLQCMYSISKDALHAFILLIKVSNAQNNCHQFTDGSRFSRISHEDRYSYRPKHAFLTVM